MSLVPGTLAMPSTARRVSTWRFSLQTTLRLTSNALISTSARYVVHVGRNRNVLMRIFSGNRSFARLQLSLFLLLLRALSPFPSRRPLPLLPPTVTTRMYRFATSFRMITACPKTTLFVTPLQSLSSVVGPYPFICYNFLHCHCDSVWHITTMTLIPGSHPHHAFDLFK